MRLRDFVTAGLAVLAMVPMLLGSLWLVFWLTGLAGEWAKEGVTTIKANMALCQVLAGIALFLLGAAQRSVSQRWAGVLAAGVVFLTGTLTLSQHVFGFDLGIDQLLAREVSWSAATASPNRMGPPGAIGLTLLGAGLLLLATRYGRHAPWLGVATCMVALIPAVGFLYGINEFYSLPRLTGIAWGTVVAMICLGLGLIAARPEQSPLAELLREDAGGALLRRSWPAVVMVPLLLGYLRVLAQEKELFTTAAGTGVLVIALILVFSVLLWMTAARLSRAAEGRARAEADVRSVALFPEENPFPVMRVNKEGMLLYANAAAGPVLEEWDCARNGRVPAPVMEVLEKAWRQGGREAFEVRVAERVFCLNAVPIAGRDYINVYGLDITPSKRAEERLREANEGYELVLEGAEAGIWDWDVREHRVLFSPRWKAMHGFAVDEIKGLEEEWSGGIHPEDAPRVMAAVQDHFEGKTAFFSEEYRARRKDGTWMWIADRGIARRDKEGRVIRMAGSERDITERKRAEEALREAESRFRAVFESSSDCILVWDRDYNYLYANRAAIEHVGTTPEKVIGRNIRDGLGHVPEFMRLWMARVDRAFATGEPFRVEDAIEVGGRMVHSESQISPIRDVSGKVFAVGVVYRDVTERKRAEDALRDSEQRLRLAQAAGQVGIHDYNPVTGALHWDARMRRIWGIGPDDPVDYEVFISAVHPEDRAGTHAAVQRALDPASEGTFAVEYRLVTGGRVRWIGATGKTTFENGRAVRFVGTAQDITERREFQAELERLVAERTARLQELVGELEHFSYTITHDMRAPLRAMMGFAELASAAWARGTPTETKDYLERISVAAERMDALIRDALSYSQAVRQELPLEDVDTGALLRGMLDSYPEFQASKARIRVEGRLPVVLGNEAGLTQCFSNLLGNAVKFVRPGQMPEVRVWAEEGESWARIWVEDNGIGIPGGMLPRVFNMFARGTKGYEGTGIGLALVRKVAQRMGGKVGVESEEGKGSRFWLEFKTGVDAISRMKGAAKSAWPGGGTVLYVEDEEGDAAFMERAFVRKGLGGSLRLVGDGRAAIEYLSGAGKYGERRDYPEPEVVLLDLNLPEMGGFEVLRWMRNHPDFKRTPVVVFSSSAREEDRAKAERLGATDFLTKPTSGLEFGEVVDRLRERWLRDGGLSPGRRF